MHSFAPQLHHDTRKVRQHTLDIAEYVRVPIAFHNEAIIHQPGRSITVRCQSGFGRVLPAIEFNDELKLEAIEVDDEGSDWSLTPESRVLEPFSAKLPPQQPLGVGHIGAKRTRVAQLARIGW